MSQRKMNKNDFYIIENSYNPELEKFEIQNKLSS